ncbi:hypothetical protein SDC9_190996 [bioreactor metagenome]|uniref:Uncharacterized protein n=1 Tax=bioreactor metagenome TaxID=1076179 RepID=A0A645HXV7_9ZZZZ
MELTQEELMTIMSYINHMKLISFLMRQALQQQMFLQEQMLAAIRRLLAAVKNSIRITI